MVLDVAKMSSITFGLNHVLGKEPVLSLSINDESIQQIKGIKLLGTITDDKLSWTNYIVVKTVNGISVIKRCAKWCRH